MIMHTRLVLIVLVCLFVVFSVFKCPSAEAGEDSVVLADKGKSDYRIVISADAEDAEKFAATELQGFLQQISGAELSIVTDAEKTSDYEILLGNNAHLKSLDTTIDFEKLGKEGFTIRSSGNRLIIAANSGRGTMYGVYTFLEDYLGCRWFTSKVNRIPKQKRIELFDIDDTQVPVLEFREVYYADPMDPVFAGRLKLNGNASKMDAGRMVAERHAGWGTWCHTSFIFVPPEKYFKDHPEYYSLVDGKRQAQQLCFSNPDVLEITAKKIENLIEQPIEFIPGSNKFMSRKDCPVWADNEDIYFDVSQQDSKTGACQCAECKGHDDREGSHIGSILAFINKLAARFPDKVISTLSYQYTRIPPKQIKPARNVAIMLCNIECARTLPIVDSPFPDDKAFKENIQKWSTICNNLFIWDYVVNFGNLVMPNPNFHIQQSNIKFFIEHNVKGIFAQASREVGGEFCELRNYLLAKLLWNPDYNVDVLMDEFLDAYYGPAAQTIRQYIDLMRNTVVEANEKVGIYEGPAAHVNGYLSEAMLERYAEIFDKAEQIVADDKVFLSRVKIARLPIMYTQIVNGYGKPADRVKVLDEFYDLCKENGIKRLAEWGTSPEQFKKTHHQALLKELGVK